jgi:hypothetical protein
MLTQATNRTRNNASTRPMVTHSMGRSGGQPALSPPQITPTMTNGPPNDTTVIAASKT